jgi:hypothetical protein
MNLYPSIRFSKRSDLYIRKRLRIKAYGMLPGLFRTAIRCIQHRQHDKFPPLARVQQSLTVFRADLKFDKTTPYHQHGIANLCPANNPRVTIFAKLISGLLRCLCADTVGPSGKWHHDFNLEKGFEKSSGVTTHG